MTPATAGFARGILAVPGSGVTDHPVDRAGCSE